MLCRPPLSIVPWYESPENGDTTGYAVAVGHVNELQRQVRFVNAEGESTTTDYPQFWQYWCALASSVWRAVAIIVRTPYGTIRCRNTICSASIRIRTRHCLSSM